MHYDSEKLAITISETAETIQKVYPQVAFAFHSSFSVELELIEAILLRFALDDQYPYAPAVRLQALRALQQKIQNSPEDYNKVLYSTHSCANDISRLALQEAHRVHTRIQMIEKMISLNDLDDGIANLQRYQTFRSKNLMYTHSFFEFVSDYVANILGEYPEALHSTAHGRAGPKETDGFYPGVSVCIQKHKPVFVCNVDNLEHFHAF